jgi:hypothetical protein
MLASKVLGQLKVTNRVMYLERELKLQHTRIGQSMDKKLYD